MKSVIVDTGEVRLGGDLEVPGFAQGAIVFAHGSGSSRASPRNRVVARDFRAGGLATLLIDLLTPEEARVDDASRRLRFDIGLLAERLGHAVRWLASADATRELPIGLFGASTGAAAALVCAAAEPEKVGAVVSRGGRPDLAGDALPKVAAPTLLIVGALDEGVIELNESAFAKMTCVKQLDVVPAATHLFEERGALEQVARLARDWFLQHLKV